jgi:UDP-GlcNAc:undecaprenyl-phosphate/decaprenyl-phosphate GlcNAc-1-phosphate transferase
MYSLLFLGFGSLILCWILTPPCRDLLRRLGIVDRPDQIRKLHRGVIPRVGGLPIAIAYVGIYAVFLVSPLTAKAALAGHLPFVWNLLPALLVIFATGLADDIAGLRPWEKLLGQTAAAALAYWAGVRILAVGHYSTGHWWWSLPLTALWLIGCANAFNLIDGLDGLAAGVGLFSTVVMLIAALIEGNMMLALATIPLAGCLLGFLRYNFPPASIFLGDSGSLLIGFLLGTYGVIWSQKSTTLLSMAAPLVALALPLLDTSLAIARRYLRSDSIFGPDRSHIHHRLLDLGIAPRNVTLTLYAVCSLFGGLALLLNTLRSLYAGFIVLLFAGAAGFMVSRLRYVEFGIARRMLTTGVFRHMLKRRICLARLETRLLAARSVEESWLAIREAASEFNFSYLHLRLAGEAYEEVLCESARCEAWQLDVPVNGEGWLTLKREFDSPAGSVAIGMFIDLLYRLLNPKQAIFEASLDNLRLSVGGPGVHAPRPEAAVKV